MSDLRLKQKYPHKAVIIGVLISRARLFLLPAHEISVHEKPAHDISYNPPITHSHPILDDTMGAQTPKGALEKVTLCMLCF